MGSLGAVLKHPNDLFPLLKLKRAMKHAEKQIPPEPHWGFCYSMLHKVSRSFALVIQQLDANLRNAVRPGNFLSFLCLLWWVFFFFFFFFWEFWLSHLVLTFLLLLLLLLLFELRVLMRNLDGSDVIYYVILWLIFWFLFLGCGKCVVWLMCVFKVFYACCGRWMLLVLWIRRVGNPRGFAYMADCTFYVLWLIAYMTGGLVLGWFVKPKSSFLWKDCV